MFHSLYVHRLHGRNQVFHLYTIGTNILYSCRSYLTRYKRQVLSTVPATFRAIIHKIIPYHTSTYTHRNLFFIFSRYFNATNVRMQYHSFIISGKQQIAPSANMQIRRSDTPVGNQLLQFFYRTVFQKHGSFHINPECIRYLHLIFNY